MKNTRRIIWGVILIIAAVVLALNSFNVINFNIFFDGWWTLFIIVPSLAALIRWQDVESSLFGLALGVLLLLSAQEVINWDIIWKILLPLTIAIIGFKLIFSSIKSEKRKKKINNINFNIKDSQKGVAVFCGTEMNFDGAVFEGAELITVFGGIDCDLRGAIIEKDCVIKVVCVFGGVDLLIPDNVNVVSNIPTFFGGTDVLKKNHGAEHTIYIDGVCLFGGVDAK